MDAVFQPTKRENEQIPWTNIRVKLGQLNELARKDERQIITALRQQYGLKVLVLDRHDSRLPSNVNLSSANEFADFRAVQYYSEDRFQEVSFGSGDMLAQYLAPYEYRNLTRIGQRPLADRHLILLQQNSPKMALLHEVLHYLSHPAAKPVRAQGLLIDEQTAERLNAKQVFDSLAAQARNEEPSPALLATLADVVRNNLQRLETTVRLELGIRRLMHEKRDALGMTTLEQRINLEGAINVVDDTYRRIDSAILPVAERLRPAEREQVLAQLKPFGEWLKSAEAWFSAAAK
jgi:hypothetical protein